MAQKNWLFAFGLLILFIIPFTYAWSNYGGDYPQIKQSQNYPIFSDIQHSNNFTISSGYKVFSTQLSYQPLMSYLGDNKKYVVFPNYDVLTVLNSTLGAITTINTTEVALGQIAITDYDNDGLSNDIVGWYRSNATFYKFKVYTFNITGQILSETYSYNYTNNGTFSTLGVRCLPNNCYSVIAKQISSDYSVNLFNHNITGVTLTVMPYSITGIPLELPSIDDINDDGIPDYLLYSAREVDIFSANQTVWAYNSFIVDGITNVKFARFVQTPQLPRLAVVRDIPFSVSSSGACPIGAGFSFSCSRLSVYNASTQIFVGGINMLGVVTSGDFITTHGFSISDYNNDGYEDYYSDIVRSISNNAERIIVIDGKLIIDTFPPLYYRDFAPTGNAGALPNTQTIVGRLDADIVDDLLIEDGGYMEIFSLSGHDNSTIYNITLASSNIGCTIDDINGDSASDILCGASTLTHLVVSSNFTGLCNINNSCDTGENIISCPIDCTPVINNTGNQTTYTQSSTGGIPIPTQLVSSDGNTGLLPEIYYGMLGFLSNTLVPMIIIVFSIIIVLIIFTLGTIIKKIFQKVGK